jgi:hypothetical protein
MEALTKFKFDRIDMTLEGRVEDGKLVIVIDTTKYPEACMPFNLNESEAKQLVSAIKLTTDIAKERRLI